MRHRGREEKNRNKQGSTSMNKGSLIYALALAATTMFAGNANAQTLDADAIQELLEHPVMVDNDELSLDAAEQASQVKAMIQVVFEPLEVVVPGVVDEMKRIGYCESNLNHLWPENHPQAGELKVNSDPKSSASGVMQVLLITHQPDYQRYGLDPRNAPDNLVFSRYMVERKLRAGRPPFEDWVCA